MPTWPQDTVPLSETSYFPQGPSKPHIRSEAFPSTQSHSGSSLLHIFLAIKIFQLAQVSHLLSKFKFLKLEGIFIYICLKQLSNEKAKRVPISKWVDQKTMVRVHNEILHRREKEGAPALCNSMDGTGEHYVKWNKPESHGKDKYHMISPLTGT